MPETLLSLYRSFDPPASDRHADRIYRRSNPRWDGRGGVSVRQTIVIYKTPQTQYKTQEKVAALFLIFTP